MKKRIIFCAFLVLTQCFLSFGQFKVTFKIDKIPSVKEPAAKLYLAGDFNDWRPGDKNFEIPQTDNGSYQVTGPLPKGTYNFKITRGTWQTAECNSDGKPIANRSVTIAHDTVLIMNIAGWQDNFASEEKKHTASKNVHIIDEKFDMPQLGRQRRVWIYLPSAYASSKKTYPVIYMQDGQNLFDELTSAYGEWGVDEIMDKLPEKDQCIIVAADHGGEHRMTEYNAYDSEYGKGEGSKYVDFVVNTLKPYIDKHYRTEREAAHTTIAGSSMGGLISMYAVLKYPNVFGNGGIFSPSFWIAPDMYQYARGAAMNKKSRFYFVCGDSESDTMVSDMQKMAELVRTKGLTESNTPVVIAKGAKHNEKQWNNDFPAFYNWLRSNASVKQ